VPQDINHCEENVQFLWAASREPSDLVHVSKLRSLFQSARRLPLAGAPVQFARSSPLPTALTGSFAGSRNAPQAHFDEVGTCLLRMLTSSRLTIRITTTGECHEVRIVL
jgi:hypothetical protein